MRIESLIWMVLVFALTIAITAEVYTDQVKTYNLPIAEEDVFGEYVNLSYIQDVATIKDEVDNATGGVIGGAIGEDNILTGSLKAAKRVPQTWNVFQQTLNLLQGKTGFSSTLTFYFFLFLGITLSFGILYFIRGTRSW